MKFFHMKLPIMGQAPTVHFDDGDYKFWSIYNSKGQRCLTFREMLGIVTLQERLDTWLREECSRMPEAGYKMIWADHVRPATADEVIGWAKAHPKQMEHFRA